MHGCMVTSPCSSHLAIPPSSHLAAGEVLQHLLGVQRLGQGDHVTRVLYKEDIQVPGLLQVANHLTAVIVFVVEAELNVVHPRLHEDVDHGEVDVAGVGEGQVAHGKSLSGRLHITELLIAVLRRVDVTDGNVVVVAVVAGILVALVAGILVALVVGILVALVVGILVAFS